MVGDFFLRRDRDLANTNPKRKFEVALSLLSPSPFGRGRGEGVFLDFLLITNSQETLIRLDIHLLPEGEGRL